MKAVSFLSKAALGSLIVFLVQPRYASADAIDTLGPVFRLVADDLSGTDGTYISTWTDRVSAGQILSPNAAGNAQQGNLPADGTGNGHKPQLYNNLLTTNGHKAVRFDASRGTIMTSFHNNITEQALWYTQDSTWVVYFTRAVTDPTNGSSIIASYDSNDAFGENKMFGIGSLRGGGTAGNFDYVDGGQPNQGQGNLATSGLAFPVGTSARLVMTNDNNGAGSVNLYRDGVLEATGSGNLPFAPESNGARDLSIGGRTSPTFGDGGVPSRYNTSGDIAEVILFNRVLSPAELATVDNYLFVTYIPEPASIALLGAGALLLARRRANKV